MFAEKTPPLQRVLTQAREIEAAVRSGTLILEILSPATDNNNLNGIPPTAVTVDYIIQTDCD
jgi:hypothetical protein